MKMVLDPCKCTFFTDVRTDPMPRHLDVPKVAVTGPGSGMPISRTLYGYPALTVMATEDMDEVAQLVRNWHDAEPARCLAPKADA